MFRPKAALKRALQNLFPTVLETFVRYRAKHLPRREVFAKIYRKNLWLDSESRSGVGSRVTETRNVSSALPRLLRELNVRTLLDAPCGDLNWIRHVELGPITYLGADIVPALISDHTERFAGVSPSGTAYKFQVLDLV